MLVPTPHVITNPCEVQFECEDVTNILWLTVSPKVDKVFQTESGQTPKIHATFYD